MQAKDPNGYKLVSQFVESTRTGKSLRLKYLSWKYYKESLSDLWIPSIKSFLIVTSFALILGSVAHIKDYSFLSYIFSLSSCNWFYAWLSDQKLLTMNGSDLIAIHAGIGAILTGLTFFVATELLNKNDPYGGQVLLYKSYFFPLLTFEVVIFLLLSWGTVNFSILIILILVALATLYSLGSVIKIALKETEMEKAKEKMFFRILAPLLDISILTLQKRIGNNYFYGLFDNQKSETPLTDNFLEVTYLSSQSEKDYVDFKLSNTGLIVDIDLMALNRLKRQIKQSIVTENIVGDNQFRDSPASPNRPKILCKLHAAYLERNNKGSLIVARIASEVVEKIGNKNIQNYIDKIFPIRMVEDDSEEVRTNISRLRDRYVTASKKGEKGELKKIHDLYMKITDKFFDSIDVYGGGFSSEQAEAERTSPYDSLKVFSWFRDDITEMYEAGLKSEDTGVISLTSYLPISLAKHAIKRGDHLVFQEFLRFPIRGYSFVDKYYKAGKTDLAVFLLDRTWRHLDELSWIHLESALKNNKITVDEFVEYSVQFLRVFQNLLKASLDKGNFAHFELFFHKTNKLFDGFQYEYSADIRGALTKFNEKRMQMLFGLGSWILELHKNTGAVGMKPYLDLLLGQFSLDIKDLTAIFLASHYDFDVGHFWGWDHWETEGHEGRVINIRILEKLENFFVVAALRSIAGKTPAQLSEVILPTNRDLVFLVDGSRDMWKTIADIETNPSVWIEKQILGAPAVAKIGALKKLLLKAKALEEENARILNLNSRISQDTVGKFKLGLLKSYSETFSLKKLFELTGNFSSQADRRYSGGINKFGISTLFNKSAFFGPEIPWHVTYIGLEHAFDFSSAIIKGEDIRLFNSMKDACERIGFDSIVQKIQEIGPENTLILASDQMLSYDVFEKMGNYIPRWGAGYPNQKSLENADGALKYDNAHVPVYFFNNLFPQRDILILNKKKIGKIKQLSPLSHEDITDLQNDIFLIDVQEFIPGSALMEKYISARIDWLEQYGTEEKQREHLQEHVLIDIYERFDYVPGPDYTGFVVSNIPKQTFPS